MRVNAAFDFNNVGQGLFYSGILNIKSDDKRGGNGRKLFTFAYDCGSVSDKSFLFSRIDEFKALMGKDRRLDLLVLSHLHEDHINGIQRLLMDVSVDTVVLPLLTDAIKVIAALCAVGADPFLFDFFRDPVSWLGSRGVKRIIMVPAGGLNGKTACDKASPTVNEPEISVSNGVFSTPYWQFMFGCADWTSDLVYREAERIFAAKGVGSKDISARTIDGLRKSLGRDIARLNLNYVLNRSSVVMLHMPNTDGGVAFSCGGSECKWVEARTMRTLLTADAQVRDGETLPLHSEIDGGKTAILQYPHHGADGNNVKYFESLAAGKYVLSYGVANRYMHPGIDVFSLPRLFLVNERQPFAYRVFTA